MKLTIKSILIALVCLATLTFVTGCSEEPSPYETNNADNYTVSVKYDANGGIFTTNTSVIVDSYNVSEMKKNSEGEVEIALLSPDDSVRKNDAFKAVNNGYFLAGWYEGRTEAKDSAGNTVYTYSDKWDFESDLLKIDPEKAYKSEEPVITLYAAWVPLFEIEYYSAVSGEYLDELVFDPTSGKEFSIPAWDVETGAIEMFDFPEKTGYTFDGVYLDANKETPVDGEAFEHPGYVDLETGTAKDSVLKLYVDYTEGEWYHIYNAEQLIDNASLNGNYEILADLDFEGEIWPTAFMYGNFTGAINGNGHVIKNVEFAQTNNSKVNAGLFGYLTDAAEIKDITFDNVNFTIKSGTRVVGTCYGLFAGTVSGEAIIENVSIINSTLMIDSACYFGVDDYSIGLVCGMGSADVLSTADIDCTVVGETPESLKVTVNGNNVTVETVTE